MGPDFERLWLWWWDICLIVKLYARKTYISAKSPWFFTNTWFITTDFHRLEPPHTHTHTFHINCWIRLWNSQVWGKIPKHYIINMFRTLTYMLELNSIVFLVTTNCLESICMNSKLDFYIVFIKLCVHLIKMCLTNLVKLNT